MSSEHSATALVPATRLCAPPFAHTSGPRDARMILVGEAFGQTEDESGQPFAGESGRELFRMLGEAVPHIAPDAHREACSVMKYGNSWLEARKPWLASASILLTNVLALRPPGNKMESLCGSKAEVGLSYNRPPLSLGKYLRPEYLPELSRLHAEIAAVRPNLVVALGNTACWAVLSATNIGSVRGAVATSVGLSESQVVKILATYHPAGVLRQWSWRPIVVADLMKAERESHWPEIRRPERRVLVSPTIEEIRQWVDETLASPPPYLAVDTETGASQIKCVGFARSRSEALVIPFVDLAHPSGSYWPRLADELSAWQSVQMLLESSIPKIFQNGLYDFQYLLRYPLRLVNCREDTMLLHHSMWPELQKGLGFLGSIYTNEASWKLMSRRRGKDIAVKADE